MLKKKDLTEVSLQKRFPMAPSVATYGSLEGLGLPPKVPAANRSE